MPGARWPPPGTQILAGHLSTGMRSSGGINTNVVPDVVVMRIDRRIIPEESPDTVENELIRHINQAGASIPGIRAQYSRVFRS
jgi:acetylornithine deacetylase/succinyl-diaminopimelate desuccinylase-like protein